jgi:hypothetical protein
MGSNKAACRQMALHNAALPGQIGQAADISAVNPSRQLAAERAGSRGMGQAGDQNDTVSLETELLDRKTGRQQQ